MLVQDKTHLYNSVEVEQFWLHLFGEEWTTKYEQILKCQSWFLKKFK